MIKVMRESLLHVFKRRLSLAILGDRNGVSLNFLASSSSGVFLDIASLVKFEKSLDKKMLKTLTRSEKLYKQIVFKQKKVTNLRWNAELQLFSLLYSLVSATSPKLVVETGVANGITTNAIMEALDALKQGGELHSFDVLSATSKAYAGRGKWKFHLLPSRNTHNSLKKIVEELPKVDIWVHDSNHGYRWQKFEYLLAFNSLKKGGILISDDIDASPAWAELANTHFRKSYIVFDSRKFIGVAFK